MQEKGFPVSLAMELRKERHFVQRKKRKRGVGQCLWQWDHQYQVRKPQPRLRAASQTIIPSESLKEDGVGCAGSSFSSPRKLTTLEV